MISYAPRCTSESSAKGEDRDALRVCTQAAQPVGEEEVDSCGHGLTVAVRKADLSVPLQGPVWIEMCISPNRTNPLIPPPGSPETESPNRVFQDSRGTSLKSRQTLAGLPRRRGSQSFSL